IILSLIPALGLIYFILFGYSKDLTGAIKLCRDTKHYKSLSDPHENIDCNGLKREEWQNTIGNIGFANEIFSFTMITIVLLFFIYILAKVIKYEKLKAGRDKMSLKEYFLFTKSLL
ncbi:hypothetical protein PVMG_06150, partial [Plasmodium vivax Mauritania I]